MPRIPSHSARITVGGAVAFALFVVGFQLLLAQMGLSKVLSSGALSDGDNYLWLVRVRQYLEGGSWASSVITGMNTPYGVDMHWTHPLDVAILALYAPLQFFMPMEAALFWAGATVPVLLFLMFSAALYWAVRPLLPRGEAYLVLFVSLAHPTLIAYSLLGRADHNYLILTSMVLATGGMIRLLHTSSTNNHEAAKNKAVLITGAATALGLWVSTEFEPLLALFMATPALMWLVSGQQKWLRHAFLLGSSLLLFTSIALVIERGDSLWQVQQLDKLSLIHVVALSINAALWALAHVLLTPRLLSFRARLGCLALLALAAFILLGLFTPALLQGPMGAIDPVVNAYLYEVTGELSSTLPTSFERTAVALLWVGVPISAVGLWWGMVGRYPAHRSAVWIFLTIMTLAYIVAGLLHARFAQLASPFASLFLLHTAYSVQQRIKYKSPLIPFALVLLPVLICFMASSGFSTLAEQQKATSGKIKPPTCEVEDILPTLQTLPAGRIMNDLNEGPGILYRTKHSVVAGAYHRNDKGIADALAFMRGPAALAAAKVKDRDIDFVLFCLHKRQGGYARQLATMAQSNALPNWLTPLAVPAQLDNKWFLFKVNKDKLP
jgi:hypothetical protein